MGLGWVSSDTFLNDRKECPASMGDTLTTTFQVTAPSPAKSAAAHYMYEHINSLGLLALCPESIPIVDGVCLYSVSSLGNRRTAPPARHKRMPHGRVSGLVSDRLFSPDHSYPRIRQDGWGPVHSLLSFCSFPKLVSLALVSSFLPELVFD